MSAITLSILNQIGLVLGFLGAVLLGFSSPVGTISKDGTVIFTGLDPMDSFELNAKRVHSSHWRNRIFTPLGWGAITISFLLQYLATLG